MTDLAPLLLVHALLLAAPASPGPTLAREDTMHTEVSEVLVSAPRVTLDEILDRVARGEARRDSMMQDQAFTAAVRTFHRARSSHETQLLEQSLFRVYKKRPDKLRAVLVRHDRGPALKNEKDDDHDDMEFTPSMSERMVDFAFHADARREFRFRIAGRDLIGDHLIYRIAFEPRTSLSTMQPRGLVWIDTNDFVIVREEIGFDRSPVPLFIKRLDGMVIERQRVEGYWVLKRMLMNVELTVAIPKLGRYVEFAIVCDDYLINHGVDDAVFERPKSGGR